MEGFLSVLQSIIMPLFDNILMPILQEIGKFVIKMSLDLLKKAFSWILYYIWTALLQLVAVLSNAFEYFAGTTQGKVNNGTQTVLGVFFGLDIIGKMFLIFTIVGVVLAFLFTIVNVIKSMSDMTLDDKNPISKALKNLMKSMVTFVTIPFLCMFLMRLSTIVIDTIDAALYEQGTASIDKIIWYNCSYNASTNDSLNIDGSMTEENKRLLLAGKEKSREVFVRDVDGVHYSYAYNDVNGKSFFKFDYGKFNYPLGVTAAVMLIVVLLACILTFIARIFELITLYITGPLFTSTIAQDGGEMFKQWKDMFIAKFIGSYGMVLGMRLYLILIPAISTGKIIFTTTNIAGLDGLFNAFIQVVFIVGGGYAVYKSQTLVLRLLSIEAASSARENVGMGMMLSKRVAGIGLSGVSSFGSKLGTSEKEEQERKKKLEAAKNGGGDSDEESKKSKSGSSSKSGGSGNMYRGGRPG